MARCRPRFTLFPYTTLFRSPGRRSPSPCPCAGALPAGPSRIADRARARPRSEEHTSELQSRQYLVCRLLLEKKIPMVQVTVLAVVRFAPVLIDSLGAGRRPR